MGVALPTDYADVAPVLAEYTTRLRFKKLGFTSKFEDLDEQTAIEFINIDIGVEKEKERQLKKNGKN